MTSPLHRHRITWRHG